MNALKSMPRVLFVGINPSSADQGSTSVSIKRLCRWVDRIGIRYFSFVNCISKPGKYSMKDVEYDFLYDCCKDYDNVVALGKFPMEALSKIGVECFTMPHPSGLNRNLNDPLYEKVYVEECRRYVWRSL